MLHLHEARFALPNDVQRRLPFSESGESPSNHPGKGNVRGNDLRRSVLTVHTPLAGNNYEGGETAGSAKTEAISIKAKCNTTIYGMVGHLSECKWTPMGCPQ